MSLIINYDVPQAVDDYIHRIGRTGRYDKSGMAVTLVSKKDAKLFRPIKDKAGKDLEIIDGDALLKSGNTSDGRQNDGKKSSSKKPQRKQKAEEKSKEAAKSDSSKESKAKTKEKASQADIKPDFSGAKTISVSTNDEGNFVFELKNKAGKESKPEEKTSKPKATQKEAKSPPKKQSSKSSRTTSKKQPKQPKESKQSRQPKKKIEIKTIDKAAERNKKAHKPAKGIWGLIKSFLPKF